MRSQKQGQVSVAKAGSKSRDIHHEKRKLEGELLRLERDSFPEEDKQLIRDYVHFLEANNLSKGRLAKAVYQLRTLRKHAKCNFRKLDRPSIEQIVIWINNSAYAPWSKSDAKGWLKRFYRWMRTGQYLGQFPEEVSWVKTRLKANELTEPNILTGEEVQKMIDSAVQLRDKALISVLYEGGFRIGEALNMKTGDLSFDANGARGRVTGKTGPRTVRLISSVSLLGRWLEQHPEGSKADAPLWASFAHNYRGVQLEYHSVSNILKTAARKAEIEKRIYPHLFRHSSATRDAHFLNEAELRIKYGWDRFSTMPSMYVHLASKDVDEKLISIYSGKPFEQSKPDFVPVLCQRCNEKNTPGLKYCGRCGNPLDPAKLATNSISDIQSNLRLEAVEKKLEEALGKRK
ncbi:MAG: tyrosine-type recombinase/integrase [Nitrososphaerota archaeon]|nr:tyrosine-type recombinase/integrase [Nitrososphaerota archaeon]